MTIHNDSQELRFYHDMFLVQQGTKKQYNKLENELKIIRGRNIIIELSKPQLSYMDLILEDFLWYTWSHDLIPIVY